MATVDAAIQYVSKKLTDKNFIALPQQDGGIWIVRFGKTGKGFFGAVTIPPIDQSDESLVLALNAAIKEGLDAAAKEPVLRG